MAAIDRLRTAFEANDGSISHVLGNKLDVAAILLDFDERMKRIEAAIRRMPGCEAELDAPLQDSELVAGFNELRRRGFPALR
jgi:Negative regulator of septation ring formation